MKNLEIETQRLNEKIDDLIKVIESLKNEISENKNVIETLTKQVIQIELKL